MVLSEWKTCGPDTAQQASHDVQSGTAFYAKVYLGCSLVPNSPVLNNRSHNRCGVRLQF